MIIADGKDYDLLKKWSHNFDCDGYYSCEIGVGKGMGSQIIMDNVINNYLHIGIDSYTDNVRDTLVEDLFDYSNKGRFRLANMTERLFMSHPDHQDMTFAFVHFDCSTKSQDIMTQAVWFAERAAIHSRFVFSNHTQYKFDLISEVMKFYNFEIHGTGEAKCMMAKAPRK
jgi:hypothetical protein